MSEEEWGHRQIDWQSHEPVPNSSVDASQMQLCVSDEPSNDSIGMHHLDFSSTNLSMQEMIRQVNARLQGMRQVHDNLANSSNDDV